MAQRVLITGITSGLGRALADALLQDGAELWAISRTVPGDLEGHDRLHFESCDLRNFEDIEPTVRRLLDGVETLDLAILNAGVLGRIKDLREQSVREIRGVMDVNVWANKILVDALMAHPVAVKQVVGVSSGAAVNGSGGWGPYAVSKAALNMLLRVFAREHPETHFSALAPGVIETQMIHTILAQPDNPLHAANQRIREAQAEGRIMTPAQGAARFLECTPRLLENESGGFFDVRTMEC